MAELEVRVSLPLSGEVNDLKRIAREYTEKALADVGEQPINKIDNIKYILENGDVVDESGLTRQGEDVIVNPDVFDAVLATLQGEVRYLEEVMKYTHAGIEIVDGYQKTDPYFPLAGLRKEEGTTLIETLKEAHESVKVEKPVNRSYVLRLDTPLW